MARSGSGVKSAGSASTRRSAALTDLKTSGNKEPVRATLSPRADCESMCSFVLLAGMHRWVPSEARVMVHQIWLGDRREDPIAANYSAEDLVLVQRDIGKLATYTAEMGASMDMLDLSLRIPPWEPMHVMTRDEIQRMHVATEMPDVAFGSRGCIVAAEAGRAAGYAGAADQRRRSRRRSASGAGAWWTIRARPLWRAAIRSR